MATFTFAAVLSDGNYRGVISAEDVRTAGPDGQYLADDAVSDFFFSKGDIAKAVEGGSGYVSGHDRVVDLKDWNKFAATPQGTTGATYMDGDLNYDGTVNLADFNLLAGRFGTNLAPPPSAPDTLYLSVLSESKINLNWLDNASGETGYRVQWSTDGQQFTDLPNLPANSTSHPAEGLDEGKRYWFRVRAYGDTVNTAYTPKVAATTVLLAPTELKATLDVQNRIKLTWADNSATEANFIVQSSSDGIHYSDVETLGAGVEECIDPRLPDGTLRTYRVQAKNSQATSAPSSQRTIRGDEELTLGKAGMLDPSFGSGGSVREPNRGSVLEIGEQSSGHLVALLLGSSISTNGHALVRYNASGALDTNFGINGRIDIPNSYNIYGDILVQPDDKIIYTGQSGDGQSLGILVARYLPDGQPDTSFSGGSVRKDLGAGAAPYGVALQSDGSIVVAGWMSRDDITLPGGSGHPKHAALIRFQPNGMFDSAFAGDGLVDTGFGGNFAEFRDVAIDAQDRIVAVGGKGDGWGAGTGPGGAFAIARYAPDGAADSGFGAGGQRVFDFSPYPDTALTVALQSNGRVLVGGTYNNAPPPNPNPGDSTLIRLTDTGVLDPDFDADGVLVSNFYPAEAVVDLAVQADGKIVAALGFEAVGRFMSDGSLDNSFGIAGVAHIELSSSTADQARAVDVLRDGRIAVGTQNASNPALARVVDSPRLNLIAHRTGGKLLEEVSPEVENSGDPTKYLVLTNNDFEEGDPAGGRDYDNATIDIPPSPVPTDYEGDDDLAKITLKQLHSSLDEGTFFIELSDESSARLFTSDGQELTQRELDLYTPVGPLMAIKSGDVDIYVEGLQPDEDFIFKIGYRDTNGVEVARDTVHMTLAEWTFRDFNGGELHIVTPIWKKALLEAARRTTSGPVETDPAGTLYRVQLDGLATFTQFKLKASSDSNAAEYYDDELVPDDGKLVSMRFAALYSSDHVYLAEPDVTLASSEREVLRNSLGLNALHNPGQTSVLSTGPHDAATDIQHRSISTNPLQFSFVNDVVNVGDRIRGTVTSRFAYPGTIIIGTNDGQPSVESEYGATTMNFDFVANLAGDLTITAKFRSDFSHTQGALVRILPANHAMTEWQRRAWSDLRVDGAVSADLLVRNRRINELYARLYNVQPRELKWAGMAAFASASAGRNMDRAEWWGTFDWAPLPDEILPGNIRQIGREFARANLAIYDDIYPQLLAYHERGILEIRDMHPEYVSDLQLQGWEKIAASGGGTDVALVWGGNQDLLRHEQEVVLQDIMDLNQSLWREATDALLGIPSPIPGDQTTFEGYRISDPAVPDDASIGNFEARWAWTANSLLPAWQAWDSVHWPVGIDVNRLLNSGY